MLLGEAKNALLVPIQAVHKTADNKQQVQVLTGDNRLEMREVKTGITNNVDIQILSGLKAGENVVLVQENTKPGEEGLSL
ncbi:macrolide transporter subunit MacA [compost metagenome]